MSTENTFPYVESVSFNDAVGANIEFLRNPGDEFVGKVIGSDGRLDGTTSVSSEYKRGVFETPGSKRKVLVLDWKPLSDGRAKEQLGVVITVEGTLQKNHWKEHFPRPIGCDSDGSHDERANEFYSQIENFTGEALVVIVHWNGMDRGNWGIKEFLCICRPNQYEELTNIFSRHGCGSDDIDATWIL